MQQQFNCSSEKPKKVTFIYAAQNVLFVVVVVFCCCCFVFPFVRFAIFALPSYAKICSGNVENHTCVVGEDAIVQLLQPSRYIFTCGDPSLIS